jgi:hypothetical protein
MTESKNDAATTADDKKFCETLARTLMKVEDLPAKCQQFEAIVQTVAAKEKAAADPFAGMLGATQARKNSSQGIEHHAQIQRRLTTQGQRRFSKNDNK